MKLPKMLICNRHIDNLQIISTGNILDGVTESRAVSLESLSLDDLTTSDLNEPGHMRYSQPRVRNKSVQIKPKSLILLFFTREVTGCSL